MSQPLTAAATGPTGKNQRRLRNYLINMKFQLPWVISGAAVVAMVFGTLATYVLWQENNASATVLNGLGQLYQPEEASAMNELFTSSDASIFWALFGTGGALIALMVVVGIIMTHKVAGPMHGLVRAFGAIRAGNYLAVHGFRRGDAFQNVGDELVLTARALYDREKAELDALEAVRAAGVSPDALPALNELIASKRTRVR